MDAIPLLTKSRLWRDSGDFFKPFRKAARPPTYGNNIRPLFDPDLAHAFKENDSDTDELNQSLQTLVEVFPDVEAEIFRELLTSISPESRVAVVAEQMLKRSVKATSNRTRRALGHHDRDIQGQRKAILEALPVEETFRGHTYHEAVKSTLYQEFKSLSHSTIKGVMAENNGSYVKSRPILQYLASRTWRSSLTSFWRRKDAVEDLSIHPALFWRGSSSTAVEIPSVRSTGSTQLDQELFNLLVRPLVDKQKQEQLMNDQALAIVVNEAQAVEFEATYDCECCYATTSFEQIATCDTGEHILCFDCVRRTTAEAIYGQGWARSADLEKCTLRCFAPALQECQASLPASFVQRALEQDLARKEVWPEFCVRNSTEVLLKSRVPLQRCPFCSYAEIDETPSASFRSPAQLHKQMSRILSTVLPAEVAYILAGLSLPALILLLAFMLIIVKVSSLVLAINLLFHSSPSAIIKINPIIITGPAVRTTTASLTRIHKRRGGLKFKCYHPGCLRVSCTRCLAAWQDPHTCFDTEKTSLRTAVEASATAAVKRTCPKCLLSFVKASGCNKLVCNCGFTMCYICRAEIPANIGYTHFCQHFRPSGGRCSECDRCDLYGDEDEEAAIRRAVEMAEHIWRENERKNKVPGGGDDRAARAMVEAVVGQGKKSPWVERCLDTVLDVLVVFEEEASRQY